MSKTLIAWEQCAYTILVCDETGAVHQGRTGTKSGAVLLLGQWDVGFLNLGRRPRRNKSGMEDETICFSLGLIHPGGEASKDQDAVTFIGDLDSA
jgi:hypothetical protein